jgi:hypothetical protein
VDWLRALRDLRGDKFAIPRSAAMEIQITEDTLNAPARCLSRLLSEDRRTQILESMGFNH